MGLFPVTECKVTRWRCFSVFAMTQLNEVAFLVCTFASTFEYIMHTHVQLLYADGTVCIEILLTSTFIFCWYDPLQTLALQDLQHFPAIEIRMPPSKPKPSEIAVEAKKSYIPYIRTNFSAQWPSTSYMCHSESVRSPPGNAALRDNPRFGISSKYIYLKRRLLISYSILRPRSC